MVNFTSRLSVRSTAGVLFASAMFLTRLGFGQTAFQQGTLSVIRYGEPTTTTLNLNTVPVFLEEYTTAAPAAGTTKTPVRTIAIPTVGSGSNFNFVGSAFNNNTDGIVGISPDRSRLSIGGYDLPTNTSNPTGTTAPTSGTTNRVVGVFTANGAFQATTAFAGTGGQPLRSTMVTNTGALYLGVGAAGAAGLRYAAAATYTTPTVVPDNVITASLNTQKMQIYNGDLYLVSTSSTASTGGTSRLRKYTGLPTSAALPTDLPGIPVNASGVANSTAFVMFDVDRTVAGPDLLYYTDDATAGSTINKYTYNGTTWTLRGSYTVANTGTGAAVTDGVIRDITGRLENGVVTLYAVTFSSLIRFTDAATYATAPNITQTVYINNNTYNAQNTGGTAFYSYKGISFSPGTVEQITLATASAQLTAKVTLYPNPAQGEVQLSLPAELQNEKLAASVVNMLGQTVSTRSLSAGAVRSLPLAGLAAGVYTLRLETSQGTITKRLVCE